MPSAKRTTIYITKEEMDDLIKFVPEDMAARVAQWGFKRALEWAKKYGESFVMNEIINDRKKYEMLPKATESEEVVENVTEVNESETHTASKKTEKKVKVSPKQPALHVKDI